MERPCCRSRTTCVRSPTCTERQGASANCGSLAPLPTAAMDTASAALALPVTARRISLHIGRNRLESGITSGETVREALEREEPIWNTNLPGKLNTCHRPKILLVDRGLTAALFGKKRRATDPGNSLHLRKLSGRDGEI